MHHSAVVLIFLSAFVKVYQGIPAASPQSAETYQKCASNCAQGFAKETMDVIGSMDPTKGPMTKDIAGPAGVGVWAACRMYCIDAWIASR